jgi:hypothetical protein
MPPAALVTTTRWPGSTSAECRNVRHVTLDDGDAVEAGELRFSFPGRTNQRRHGGAAPDQRAHQIVAEQACGARHKDFLAVQFTCHSGNSPNTNCYVKLNKRLLFRCQLLFG